MSYILNSVNEVNAKTESKIKKTRGNKLDKARIVFLLCAVFTACIIVFLVGFVFYTSIPVFQQEGIGFITGSNWDYNDHVYGISVFIAGTIFLTITTIIIACPLSILTAIFLAEYSPPSRRKNTKADDRAASRHPVGRIRHIRAVRSRKDIPV